MCVRRPVVNRVMSGVLKFGVDDVSGEDWLSYFKDGFPDPMTLYRVTNGSELWCVLQSLGARMESMVDGAMVTSRMEDAYVRSYNMRSLQIVYKQDRYCYSLTRYHYGEIVHVRKFEVDPSTGSVSDMLMCYGDPFFQFADPVISKALLKSDMMKRMKEEMMGYDWKASKKQRTTINYNDSEDEDLLDKVEQVFTKRGNMFAVNRKTSEMIEIANFEILGVKNCIMYEGVACGYVVRCSKRVHSGVFCSEGTQQSVLQIVEEEEEEECVNLQFFEVFIDIESEISATKFISSATVQIPELYVRIEASHYNFIWKKLKENGFTREVVPNTIFGYQENADSEMLYVFKNCVVGNGIVKDLDDSGIQLSVGVSPKIVPSIPDYSNDYPSLDVVCESRAYLKNSFYLAQIFFKENFPAVLLMSSFALASVNFHHYSVFPMVIAYSPTSLSGVGKSTASFFIARLLGFSTSHIKSELTDPELHRRLTRFKNTTLLLDDLEKPNKDFKLLVKRLFNKLGASNCHREFSVNCALMVSTNERFCEGVESVERRIVELSFKSVEKDMDTIDFEEKTRHISCILKLILKMDYSSELYQNTQKMCMSYVSSILGQNGLRTVHSERFEICFFYVMFISVLCEMDKDQINAILFAMMKFCNGLSGLEMPKNYDHIITNMTKIVDSVLED